MKKQFIPIIIIFLLLSSSFIGLSFKTEKAEDPQQTMNGGLMDSAWPMKCHDQRHASQSPYSTENNLGYEIWRFITEDELGGAIESSPVVDSNGIIYFGTMGADHNLYALYPNGTKKWSYEAGGLIWSTPALSEDGTIYVGSWDTGLYAIFPNGTKKWRFGAGGSISSSPAIEDDGTIYFGTMREFDKGDIIAVNANGTEKWRYETDYFVVSDPAIGDDGTIYIGSSDTYLYAVWPNGTLRWRFKTGDYVKGHPSIAEDGTIYIPSWDDYLYALYPNGTMRWKTGIGPGSSGSAAIANDGTIYLFTDRLRAFYPNNGTVKWSLDIGGDGGHTSPAISADGTIYICNDEGKHILAINPEGFVKWQYQLCNLRAESSPTIAEDGTIYVGSSYEDEQGHWRGFLHALNTLDPNAPSAPTITGPTQGTAGVEYNYTFASEDPNDDMVYYYIEWGDKAHEYKIGPYHSGEDIILPHTWKAKGTYTIRARGIDTDNHWGPYGELEIEMPFSYSSLFQNFFNRFPRMFPILRNLLRM